MPGYCKQCQRKFESGGGICPFCSYSSDAATNLQYIHQQGDQRAYAFGMSEAVRTPLMGAQTHEELRSSAKSYVLYTGWLGIGGGLASGFGMSSYVNNNTMSQEYSLLLAIGAGIVVCLCLFFVVREARCGGLMTAHEALVERRCCGRGAVYQYYEVVEENPTIWTRLWPSRRPVYELTTGQYIGLSAFVVLPILLMVILPLKMQSGFSTATPSPTPAPF